MTTILNADYLIVGSGAVGMAFADVLLSETDATMIIVDRNHKPGGHWNHAYPFVTLHQPSQFYGVSSRELSSGLKDQLGLNKGLAELATGAEIMAYFDAVMRQQFLPSGRVQYFPMCEYDGDFADDHRFHSLTSGDQFSVDAIKVVDASWLNTSVPLTHTPSYSVDEEAHFIPLNHLPMLDNPAQNYVVIGGGKTGIDACLWLLEQGVPADKIQWIVSRDAWLLNRRNAQPGIEFFHDTIGTQAAYMEAIAEADSVADMFDRLEAELEALRPIRNVVRLGKVQHICGSEIHLQNGTIPTSRQTVHVDCSATAINNKEMKPVFSGKLITPQMVRPYQPVFSAALIAHVEASFDRESSKNSLCAVVPLPDEDIDFLQFTATGMLNQYQWSQEESMRRWLVDNRLDGFSRMIASIPQDDTEKMAVLGRLRAASEPAMKKLHQFLAGQGR